MNAMQIAYHTTDEVSLDAAKQTAQECGVSLSRCLHSDVRLSGTFSAILYDLDHMHIGRGQAIVSELLSRRAPCPEAVHGYNLGEEEMTDLHANGVIVSRKFDPEVVRALCRASEFSPGTESNLENQNPQGALDDPAVLCGTVRALASRTHRALRRTPDGICDDLPHEIGELQKRIDQLQQQIIRLRRQHDLRLEDVQRWLDSLRRRVEGVLTQRPYESEE